jgi:hypothetical protein
MQIKHLQTRYTDLLPVSTLYWTLANEGNTYQKARTERSTRGFTVKVSNIIRDTAVHLAYHTSFISV